MIKKILLKCPKCGYAWYSRTKNKNYVTCPGCMRKIKISQAKRLAKKIYKL